MSPDFLSLFQETAWLLEADPSLWCVSAWNDLGFQGVATNHKRLFRTDYFPGLGWMLRREVGYTWCLPHPNQYKAPHSRVCKHSAVAE